MNFAVGEAQRRYDVVGNTFLVQIVQDRIVKRAVGIGKAAAECLPGFDHVRHRAVAEHVALQKIERSLGDDGAGIGPPNEAASHDLRMQRADEHHSAPQRQSGRRQALAEFGQYFLRQRLRPRAVDEPIDDRLGGKREGFHRLTPDSVP